MLAYHRIFGEEFKKKTNIPHFRRIVWLILFTLGSSTIEVLANFPNGNPALLSRVRHLETAAFQWMRERGKNNSQKKQSFWSKFGDQLVELWWKFRNRVFVEPVKSVSPASYSQKNNIIMKYLLRTYIYIWTSSDWI